MLIECNKLSKSYKGIPVFKDVSFNADEGQIFGIEGPNKAGKTTLLKILAGLILPTTGDLRICGLDAAGGGRAVSGRIGWASGEDRSFYWRLTGRQNLEYFASLYGLGYGRSKIEIERLSAVFGLEEDLDKPVYLYSSGIKQKLAIVRAVIHSPSVLLMDELTKSLDRGFIGFLFAWLKDTVKKSGMAVLISSHSRADLEALTSEILDLRDHKV